MTHERRTLIRRRADSALAGRLQGSVSPWAGEVVEQTCRFCGGTGTYIGGDESHVCWCQREAAEDRADWEAKQ